MKGRRQNRKRGGFLRWLAWMVLGVGWLGIVAAGCRPRKARSEGASPAAVQTAPAGAQTFVPGNYANRPSEAVLQQQTVVGVLVSARWKDMEPQQGVYDWRRLDASVARVAQAGKVVVLNVMTSGVNVPQWLRTSPRVSTFTFEAMNPHQPIYGQRFTVPVYWDAAYLEAKRAFVQALGARYAQHPAVVGVMASFVGTVNNDWFIPSQATEDLLRAGYTSERMLAAGEATLDMWAEAFPRQALKLPVGKSLPDGGHSQTWLAAQMMAYGYAHYPERFYAQINGACTALPAAESPEVQQAPDGTLFYLLKLFRRHPHQVGFQMLCDATHHAARLDKGHVCEAEASSCAFSQTLTRVLTYAPYYIEYWHEDVENPAFQPKLLDVQRALQVSAP